MLCGFSVFLPALLYSFARREPTSTSEPPRLSVAQKGLLQGSIHQVGSVSEVERFMATGRLLFHCKLSHCTYIKCSVGVSQGARRVHRTGAAGKRPIT